MIGIISIPIVEANLLRNRIRNLLSLREEFLSNTQQETIHDLRVASRRAREVLDYLEPALPAKLHSRLWDLSRRITKSLGTARESEVNLSILNQWTEERKIDPVAAELLIHSQKLNQNKGYQKAKKRISQPKYRFLNKFLLNLKGSRTIPITQSEMLSKRHLNFVTFQWDRLLDDENLHDLRIRTKKFRYAVEIHNRIHKLKLGRFIRRIRNLQDVLGRIHDLYVLQVAAEELIREWDDSDLSIIPSALKFSRDIIVAEKEALYIQVYPRFSKILESAPRIFFQDTHAAAV
ncbi:MAG TPA: CHAD domain-containing protein [Acidobacteriota bacterium]|nr:CHAD domain-containing protein [Acidobacteriota bacterium]